MVKGDEFNENIVHVYMSPSNLECYDIIISKITDLLKVTCCIKSLIKVRMDLLVAPCEALFIDASVQFSESALFLPFQVGGRGAEKLEQLLLALYRQMQRDEKTKCWNKARFLFDVGKGKACLAYRWDEDYSWFVDGYLEDSDKACLSRDSGRQLLSWEGLSKSEFRPWRKMPAHFSCKNKAVRRGVDR